VTPAYVVNRPSLRVPHTRTVETKHASGQLIGASVVSTEHPGAVERHYPVATVDGRFEARNDELKRLIIDSAPRPVWFCGRLANYQYIDQDEAIRQGLDCATEIAATSRA
jgi:UDP-galactopyranose mutase